MATSYHPPNAFHNLPDKPWRSYRRRCRPALRSARRSSTGTPAVELCHHRFRRRDQLDGDDEMTRLVMALLQALTTLQACVGWGACLRWRERGMSSCLIDGVGCCCFCGAVELGRWQFGRAAPAAAVVWWYMFRAAMPLYLRMWSSLPLSIHRICTDCAAR